MTETKPKRRWFRFSIRDLLWLTALVAVSVGWWLDHGKAPRYTIRTIPPGFDVLDDSQTGTTRILSGELP